MTCRSRAKAIAKGSLRLQAIRLTAREIDRLQRGMRDAAYDEDPREAQENLFRDLAAARQRLARLIEGIGDVGESND